MNRSLQALVLCGLVISLIHCKSSDTSIGDSALSDASRSDSDLADAGADGPAPPPELAMGVLQFRVRHNLGDDSCKPSCYLEIEENEDIASWLAQIRAVSNLAVLHWDRSIPWLVFDVDPPAEANRVSFYDARMDAELLAWIDAFADHFAEMPRRYLSVTPLDGTRTSLSPCRIDPETDEVTTSSPCPTMIPGSVVDFEYNSDGAVVTASFDLERAFQNFVLYLYEKLEPDYLALMIETNMFKEACPTKWGGLVKLYHALFDAVRAEVDPAVKVFATLTYKHLLGFSDAKQCIGTELEGEPCTGEPTPVQYPEPDPGACYPLELSALHDLDQGDRLDVLALSFYPDDLLMATGEDTLLRFYPGDWDGTSDRGLCIQRIPFCDPFDALDRIGWTKPVGVAEMAARSCRTLAFLDSVTEVQILQTPGDNTSQAFWLDHGLETASQRGFEFYLHPFLNDYRPLGLWCVNDVLDPWTYNVFNAFPCMGIRQQDGAPKDLVTDVWLSHLP